MPKKKGGGTKVTLKAAKKAVQKTPEGLRRLTYSKLRMAAFPVCLVKLPNLHELQLCRNLMRELPENLGNLSSLKWLDLHTNKLESVPESIGKLVALTHLNLSNNCLTSAGLPSTLGSLSKLKTLNLGLNKLDSLPPSMEALESLEELSLFDNLFTTIPEFIDALPNLTKLNTKRNPLSCVQDIKKSEAGDSSLCLSEEQKEGDSVRVKSKERSLRYAGLTVPNSVAKLNQDEWRIRKKFKQETVN
uniref:leucine-rich repeat-containing protein 18 n=1 Tax=Solea senegalensis TaxID=28829 RepID=UPI001CD8505B|nr:leucine-rich repeat-containing protein 18 [Solea senegalensis]